MGSNSTFYFATVPKEDYGDEEGTGTFTLVIKQKKDKISTVTVEGGYTA